MAKPTVDQLRALGDFATTYQWDVKFVKAPVGLQALEVRCETTELPKATNQHIPVTIRGVTTKQPGITTPLGTLTMTFIETVDAVTSRAIAEWRRLCGDMKTGNGLPKRDCEAILQIKRLNRQGGNSWNYTLIGVTLEDADLGVLDGSNADVFRPAMVLSYDYFEEG